MATGLLKIVAIVAMFAPCAIGPGLLIVRRQPWAAAERIAAAFAYSVLLLGGATFAIYLLHAPERAYSLVLLLAGAAFAVGWRDVVALRRDPDGRRVLSTYLVVTTWMLGCLGLIRSYGRGGWERDWVEQYTRVGFFLWHFPLDTRMNGLRIPARPPLLNLVCVPFFSVTGAGMAQFQTLCALLGCGAVFPVFLIARRVAPNRAVPLVVLLAVIAFNPMMVANATYPWTKLLAAALVATGLCFYVAGWRLQDGPQVRTSAIILAAGVLTHYSAAPYALAVAAHFVLFGSRQFSHRLRAIGAPAGLAVAVIGSYIAWSIHSYGWHTTFGENTTAIAYGHEGSSQTASMIVENIVDTIMPFFFRGVGVSKYAEPGFWGTLNAGAFLTYQTNALLMLGLGGAAAIGCWAWRERLRASREEAVFWAIIAGSGLVVGVGAHPFQDPFGLAHIALQTLCVLGLGVVAGTWCSWSSGARRMLLAALAFDLVVGVALPVIFESRTFGEDPARDAGLMPGALHAASAAADRNWVAKSSRGDVFLGDLVAPVKWWVAAGLAFAAVWLLGRVGGLTPRPADEVDGDDPSVRLMPPSRL